MNKTLTPDIDQARRHLHILDKTATAFTFQVFDDNVERKDPSLAKTLHGTLDGFAKTLEQFQSRGAGVFVTINATQGGRRKKSDITAYRAIWREADEPGLPPLPIEPHLIVESSPGHAHEYLIIEPNTAIERGDSIMQTMVDRFGSCPGAKDRARVLRLAGFYHLKNPARPHLVHIIHESGRPPYTLDQVAEVIPPAKTQGRGPLQDKPRHDGAMGTPYGIKALEKECAEVSSAPVGTRNNRFNRAAFACAQLVAAGELDEQYARRELTHAAQNTGLSDSEARQTLESGWRAGSREPRKAPEKNRFTRPAPAAPKETPVTAQAKVFPPRTAARAPVWVIVRSESDAELINQDAGDLVGAVALGSVAARPDEALAGRLRGAALILNALDSDVAGAKAHKWWSDHFPQADRWPVPGGKDPGDYRKAGGDIRAWIRAGLPLGLRPVEDATKPIKTETPAPIIETLGVKDETTLLASALSPSPSTGEGRGEGETILEDDDPYSHLTRHAIVPCPRCGAKFEVRHAPGVKPSQGPCWECVKKDKDKVPRYLRGLSQ